MSLKSRSVLPLSLATLTVLSGCGGGGSKNPVTPSTPTPPPRVRNVVSEGSQGDVGVNVLLYVPFSNPTAGDLDITVDWTFPSDLIHIFVSPGQCTIQAINANQCGFITESPPSSVKPRRVTVTGVSAGDHTLYIGNRGPEIESVSWQVGLTSGGTASSPIRAQAVRVAPLEDWSLLLKR